MAYYGAEAAVEAMNEFLTNSDYGLNTQLSNMRSREGPLDCRAP